MPIQIKYPISLDLLNKVIFKPNLTKNAIYQSYIEKVCNLHNITDNLKFAAFIANIGVETDSFNISVENHNYSDEKLTARVGEAKFVSGISNRTNSLNSTQLGYLSADRRKILDFCYNRKSLGNREVSQDLIFVPESGVNYTPKDGFSFRGRGALQMTGREAYTKFEKFINTSPDRFFISDQTGTFNITTNPDLIADNNSLYIWSAGWEFSTPSIFDSANKKNIEQVRRLVNGDINNIDETIQRYNYALKALGEELYSNDLPQSSSNKNVSSNVNDDELERETLTVNFANLAQNIFNAESDNVDVSWGNRSSAQEESDFIGLKQYILYLMTRFYPQRLVPFVELIPFFTIKDIYSQIEVYENKTKTINSNGDVTTQTNIEERKPKLSSLINETRYNLTASKLAKLKSQDGIDLLTIDPFEEFTSSFNKKNEAGETIESLRNLSYKVYGSLVLNPSEMDFATSKPGAIGLQNIEVQIGAPEHYGMSLVNIEIKDIQGNKLLDPNSPWSFILNSGARKEASDFFFRFGWQLEIPTYNENEIWEDDIMASSFWKHEGWNIFASLVGEKQDKSDSSKIIKKYISDRSIKGSNTLTFTQNLDINSLTSPGFKTDLESGTLRRNRGLGAINNNYYTLTLINSDINTDRKDGSVSAMLNFRTKAAVANCLCPLFLSENTRQVAKKENFTLSELMIAFINDNKNNLIKESEKDFEAIYKINDIQSWLTVIGGVNEGESLGVNPDDIKMTIEPDLAEKITQVTDKDTTLLIAWLTEVLNHNKMSLIASGAYGQNVNNSNADVSSGFVIVTSEDNLTSSNKNLGDNDITFGEFLRYSETDTNSKFFIGNRLLTQDDVLGFRFQGSLVEEINIEKNSNVTQQTQQAKESLTREIMTSNKSATDPSDVSNKNPQTIIDTVSLNNKENNIAIIYSQMGTLHATVICHPWLKLGRGIYVKGMGFWDGKYIVTKLTHKLTLEGKFTTEISASRVILGDIKKSNKSNKSKNSLITSQQVGREATSKFNNSIIRGDISGYKGVLPTTLPSTSFEDEQKRLANNTSVNVTTPTKVQVAPELKGNSQQEPLLLQLHPAVQNRFRKLVKSIEKEMGKEVVILNTYLPWETLSKGSTLNLGKTELTGNLGRYRYKSLLVIESYFFWGMAVEFRFDNVNFANNSIINRFAIDQGFEFGNNIVPRIDPQAGKQICLPIANFDTLKRSATKQFQTSNPALWFGNLVDLK